APCGTRGRTAPARRSWRSRRAADTCRADRSRRRRRCPRGYRRTDPRPSPGSTRRHRRRRARLVARVGLGSAPMNLPSLRPALRALGAALLLAALPALAEGPTEPHDRLIAGTWTVGRVSPIGFDQQVSLTFKERIGDSEDLLFKTRSWQVGVMGAYNPANWSARVEAMV